MNEASLIELLSEAIGEDFGIIVESNDPERLRQKLYPIRKAYEEFLPLAFVLSPTNPTRDLFIVNKTGKPYAEADTEETYAETPRRRFSED